MNTSQAICREREVLRRQHKALSTEDCYIFWLRRYMTALREMPEGLSSGVVHIISADDSCKGFGIELKLAGSALPALARAFDWETWDISQT